MIPDIIDRLQSALADRCTVERVGDSAAEVAARRLRRRALKGNPLGRRLRRVAERRADASASGHRHVIA